MADARTDAIMMPVQYLNVSNDCSCTSKKAFLKIESVQSFSKINPVISLLYFSVLMSRVRALAAMAMGAKKDVTMWEMKQIFRISFWVMKIEAT